MTDKGTIAILGTVGVIGVVTLFGIVSGVMEGKKSQNNTAQASVSGGTRRKLRNHRNRRNKTRRA